MSMTWYVLEHYIEKKQDQLYGHLKWDTLEKLRMTHVYRGALALTKSMTSSISKIEYINTEIDSRVSVAMLRKICHYGLRTKHDK